MKRTPRYAIIGQPVSAAEALEAVDKTFNDDRDKLRVTIVGPEAERRAARAAIEQHPDFAALRERIAVRDYPPDHWALQVGFITTGRPTIYCQAPSGKVLHRQDDFVGGADAAVAALRRANEAYDPKRDPDLRSASFDFGVLLKPATIVVALLLGFVIRFCLSRTHVTSS